MDTGDSLISLYIIFWDFEQIFMVPLVIVIAYTFTTVKQI